MRNRDQDASYLNVQTSKGVNLYTAVSNGRLTLVAGSPFPITGQMIGASGNDFVSVGEDNVHVYALASNGAIGGAGRADQHPGL